MHNTRWESWLQISSAIAVVVGVALVILQLRQNAELIELQIMKQDNESYAENMLSVLPENFYDIRQKAFDDPESLTQLEYRALDVYLSLIVIERWRILYELSERGLLKREAWQLRVRVDARSFLANRFGRAYWERIKNVYPQPTDLVDAVDAALADAPENYTADALMDIKMRMDAAN